MKLPSGGGSWMCCNYERKVTQDISKANAKASKVQTHNTDAHKLTIREVAMSVNLSNCEFKLSSGFHFQCSCSPSMNPFIRLIESMGIHEGDE
jgi:hypothetical protein